MKNTLLKISIGAAAVFGPALALAQNLYTGGSGVSTGTTNPGGTSIFNILGIISSIFAIVIPLLVTIAVIWVIIGVIKYITADDDETQATARKTILHGIIAVFVIVSIWGLVAILNQTFDVGQGGGNTGNCQPVWNPTTQDFEIPINCTP